jgi:hypothetical protein
MSIGTKIGAAVCIGLGATIAVAFAGSVQSQSARHDQMPPLPDVGHPQNVDRPWVLLGLDMSQGAVTARDTGGNGGIGPDGLTRVPLIEAAFDTKPKCEAALRREIRKYAGLSHAEGNFGFYLCSDLRTWSGVSIAAYSAAIAEEIARATARRRR